jgi:SAM-dependent methyltransferase
MTAGSRLHWYIKIPLKVILARIPLSHKIRNKLGMFKHGYMQDYSYALNVFNGHLSKAGLQNKDKNVDKTAMELGPGESLFSALLAKSFGFKRSLLLDVGNFTLPSVEIYKDFALWLSNEGLPCPSLDNCGSADSMLQALDSQFLTHGLSSLISLPSESVDFVFSQAVLEHIHKHEFTETFKELWRVLKPGGVSTHVVDFKDHLEQSLNNLRFSDRTWEADWFAPSSGFYTNRIRLGEMVRLIEEQEFKIEVLEKSEWKTLPMPKNKLDPQFRALGDDELKVKGATLRLSKPA